MAEQINDLEKNLDKSVTSKPEGRRCAGGFRGVHKSEADELPGQVPLPPASWLRTGVALISSLVLVIWSSLLHFSHLLLLDFRKVFAKSPHYSLI